MVQLLGGRANPGGERELAQVLDQRGSVICPRALIVSVKPRLGQTVERLSERATPTTIVGCFTNPSTVYASVIIIGCGDRPWPALSIWYAG